MREVAESEVEVGKEFATLAAALGGDGDSELHSSKAVCLQGQGKLILP